MAEETEAGEGRGAAAMGAGAEREVEKEGVKGKGVEEEVLVGETGGKEGRGVAVAMKAVGEARAARAGGGVEAALGEC